VRDAIARVKEAPVKIYVEKEPATDVEVVDRNQRGRVLLVRPCTHTDHCWQVYVDTDKAIADVFGVRCGLSGSRGALLMRRA
jgi:small conductance mechanosensitive channel